MTRPPALPPLPVMPAAAFLGAFRTTLASGPVSLCGVLLATLLLQATPLAAKDAPAGTGLLVRVQPHEDENGNAVPITPDQLQHAIATIGKRLKAHGATHATITRKSDDQLAIDLPGIDGREAKLIRQLIEQSSSLQLHQVSPRNDEAGPDGKSLAQRVIDGTEIVPGYRAYPHTSTDSDGNPHSIPILVNRRAAISSAHIESAHASVAQDDAVDVTLNREGTDRMIALTEPMRGGIDRIAILLDGKVLSAPVVHQTPLGKRFIISGLNQPGEPATLAHALRYPLQIALVVEQQTTRPAADR